MTSRGHWCGLAVMLALGCGPATEVKAQTWGTQLTGICDSSAMVWQDGQLWVANDEDNQLRVYSADGALIRVAEPSLDRLLSDAGVSLEVRKSVIREMDLEAAATVPSPDGPVVFWMGSHGNRKAKVSKGKVRSADSRPNRHVLIATRLAADGTVSLVGRPLKNLGSVWLSATLPADVTGALSTAQPHHANAGGWNLEGLASDLSDPAHPALWLGFRSPVDERGRALLVRLDNPLEMTEGATAQFGSSVWLDLGGRGVRAMDRDPQGGWQIVAGPVTHLLTDTLELKGRPGLADDFALFHWDGPSSTPKRIAAVVELRPEANLVLPTGTLLVSDDGKVKVGDQTCAELPESERRARMRWLPGVR